MLKYGHGNLVSMILYLSMLIYLLDILILAHVHIFYLILILPRRLSWHFGDMVSKG
jgi:uncharacterized membrane-anchored protein